MTGKEALIQAGLEEQDARDRAYIEMVKERVDMRDRAKRTLEEYESHLVELLEAGSKGLSYSFDHKRYILEKDWVK